MSSRRNWIYLPFLFFLSLSAWAFPPMGYGNPPAGPALGVRVGDLAFQELAQLDIEYGVRVHDVAPGGPAAVAGLMPGDVLLALGDKPVYSSARLRWLVSGVSPGESVDLDIIRNGAKQRLKANFPAPRTAQRMSPEPAPGTPPAGAFLGVFLQEMTDDLREAFGAADGRGVLVAKVMEGSPAQQAGIQAGDMIVSLNGKAVAKVDDVYRAVAYFDPGAEVVVGVVRKGRASELGVTLGERKDVAGSGESDRLNSWYNPQTLRRMLPPPEYWRRMMDDMMRSLEDSWEDWGRRNPESPADYY